jgi:hypothetical protein
MSDVNTRGRVAELLDSFDRRAHANGRTVEEEVKAVLERGAPCSSEEKVAISRYFRSLQPPGLQPPLTLDEIREGVM